MQKKGYEIVNQAPIIKGTMDTDACHESNLNNNEKNGLLGSKESQEIKDQTAPPPFLKSWRFRLVLLCFLAIFLNLYLRFNLSMAIVCMAENDKAENSIIANNHTALEDNEINGAEFDWDKSTQGIILGSFFYGYICTQVLGGYLADKFGGKLGVVFGLGVMSLCSLMTPVMARLDPYALVVVRIFQGLVAGIAYLSVYSLLRNWSAPNERTTLMSLVWCGFPIALMINFPLSTALCHSGIDGGWPMVFYTPGALGIMLCILFYFLASSNPETHPHISNSERNYILSSNDTDVKEKKSAVAYPWKEILKSRKVYALWFVHMCDGWGFYLICVCLPTFLKEALHLNKVDNGLIAAVPFIGMLIFNATTGKLFDYLRGRNLTSVTNLRKIFCAIGYFGPAMCMFSLYFLSPNDILGHIIIFTISMSSDEFGKIGGYLFAYPDVAGQFSASLFGFGNTLCVIPGFVNPMLVAYLTPNGTRDEWLIVFYISACWYLLGAIVFILFGSSEPEPWAKGSNSSEEGKGKH